MPALGSSCRGSRRTFSTRFGNRWRLRSRAAARRFPNRASGWATQADGGGRAVFEPLEERLEVRWAELVDEVRRSADSERGLPSCSPSGSGSGRRESARRRDLIRNG
jgi:hypothetical protein